MAKQIRKSFNNWLKVKLEYIQGEKSYRELAEENNLSKTAIAEKSKKENWIEQKEQYQTQVEQELHEKLKNKRIQTLSEAVNISSQLIKRAKELLPYLEIQATKQPKIILDMFQQGYDILTDILDISPQFTQEIRNKEYDIENIDEDMTPEKALELINRQISKYQEMKQRLERIQQVKIETEEIEQRVSQHLNDQRPQLNG